jgi:hypothetical protein
MPVYFPLKSEKGTIPDDPTLNSFEDSKANHEKNMVHLMKECIRDIFKAKETIKDEEALQVQLSKIEVIF